MAHSSPSTLPAGLELRGKLEPQFADILTGEALAFVAKLERTFGRRRRECLERRAERQARLDGGEHLDFLSETRNIREADWKCASIPPDLRDRRVEITGPTDRKMVINALNSGAKIYMADFEDANSPTWSNMVEGQINLRDAIRRKIEFINPEGKEYRLKKEIAVLLVRPRGWHLVEKHLVVDGKPVSGALFDFGLFFFHNAKELMARGSGPYFYLPKIESHLEARIWNDVFKLGPGRAGNSPGNDPGHGFNRNHHRCIRDGRDFARIAGSFRGPELWPVGLHFFLHQKIPEQTRFSSGRSGPDHDDDPFYAFLFAALY